MKAFSNSPGQHTGGKAKIEMQPDHKGGSVGPMARGATSVEGNTSNPPTKSGGKIVGSGAGGGRSMDRASGGKKTPGHKDNRSV